MHEPIPNIITLDLETTTYNKGNPHDTRNYLVSSHIKREDAATQCSFATDADFVSILRTAMEEASLLIGANCKFDLSWLVRIGIQPRRGIRIWDVMLAEFILSGQTNSFASLNSLAERYSLGAKEPVVAEYWEKGIQTDDIPRDIIESYGNHDVDLTYQVYLAQRKDPRMNSQLEKLIFLCGLDLLVLLDMECNGFKYDVTRSKDRAAVLQEELTAIETELNGYSPTPINWDSGDQLSCFLYGGSYTEDVFAPVNKVYKSGPNKGQEYVRNEYQQTDTFKFPGYFTPIKGTALAKSTEQRPLYATAEPVLLKLKSRDKTAKRVITLLLRRATLAKLIGTYLNAMPELIEEMHWADETIHGLFNQVVARTGRLSSSRPNMQNAPEEVDEFFITRY